MACRKCTPIVEAKDAEIARLVARVDRLEEMLLVKGAGDGGGGVLTRMAELRELAKEEDPDAPPAAAVRDSSGRPITVQDIASRMRYWHGAALFGTPAKIGEEGDHGQAQ